jgi:hypothetical protein
MTAEKYDRNGIVDGLNRCLRLRSIPIGMKLFVRVLGAVHRARRRPGRAPAHRRPRRVALLEHVGAGRHHDAARRRGDVLRSLPGGALDFAVEFAKKRVFKPDPLPIAHEPTTQRHVGELAIQLEAAALMLTHAAAEWAPVDPGRRGLLAAKAKHVTTEAGLHVTSKVIELVGGRGAYRDHPVERAFRDLRTCTLMVPSMDRMTETIGKSVLGVETAMFKVAGMSPGP